MKKKVEKGPSWKVGNGDPLLERHVNPKGPEKIALTPRAEVPAPDFFFFNSIHSGAGA